MRLRPVRQCASMQALIRLIDEKLPDLKGSEFKVAAYLYRRLGGRRRDPEVEISIAALAAATGMSWRQTQIGVVEAAVPGRFWNDL